MIVKTSIITSIMITDIKRVTTQLFVCSSPEENPFYFLMKGPATLQIYTKWSLNEYKMTLQ